jgi:hypothetical protein
MNLLICNIGSSDLDRDRLPTLQGLSERERAGRILATYDDLRPHLVLPIIAKALRAVQKQGDLAGVVLIASNQGDEPPADTAAHTLWSKDTCLTAQVVARCLADEARDWRAIPPDQIQIWEIADEQGTYRDPSDYDGVRRFFEYRLPTLRAAHPDATAYLEVTGGTPAMTTGLLVAGTEVFGAQAVVMYVHPIHPLPSTLNTGKRLQAEPLRSALRSNVATYTYDAAARTLREQHSVITDRLAPGAPELLAAMLDYAQCRFNFDFPGAVQALDGGVDQLGDGRWRERIMALYAAVDAPDRTAKLEEVYHGAAARYATGAYADFLTQVVRFQENALRALCLAHGARFLDWNGHPDPDGAKLSQAWAGAQGVRFRSDRVDDTRDKLAGRALLLELLPQLAGSDRATIQPVLAALEHLEGLARLRNALTHSFDGVRRIDLARSFRGPAATAADAEQILPHLAQIFAFVAGRAVGPSPFVAINDLIFSLLREAPR